MHHALHTYSFVSGVAHVFEHTAAVIGGLIEDLAVTGVRGMAVFSAVERGLFQGFPLDVSVKDRLMVDEEPYLVPLLEAIHRQRRYLVVLTDSHRGRIYSAGWGRMDLINEIDEAVPRRQRSAGERWGKQQATIARHREDHILHYRKALVHEIERAWRNASFRGLVLFGAHETIEGVRANRALRFAWRPKR